MAKKNDSRFIPGIYNYCDRWCERCAFAHRCRVYATEKSLEAELDEDRVEQNQAFWNELEKYSAESSDEWKTFPDSFEMESDLSEEEMEEAMDEQERRDEEANERGGGMLQSSEAYSWRLHEFIKKHADLFVRAPDEINATTISALGGNTADEAKLVWLQDALEVISWHQFFITVKLKRAFHSLVDEEEHAHDWPRDSDGTAKVALIGLDRCIAAWVVVRDMLPQLKPVAVDFMLRLNRLRTKLQEQFPNARAFVRPGFDER